MQVCPPGGVRTTSELQKHIRHNSPCAPPLVFVGTCVASMPNGDILITAGTHIPMLESCVEIAHEVSLVPIIFVVAISGGCSIIL